MRVLALVAGALALATPALAQPPSVAGRWSLTIERFGTPTYSDVVLTQDGDKVTGRMFDQIVTGVLASGTLRLQGKDPKAPVSGEAKVAGDRMTGSLTVPDTFGGKPSQVAFTATRVPAAPPGPPKRHEFTPTKFERQFSALVAPVLTIAPGDTIHTTTVDAGGTDEHDRVRVLGGNPETGPFYVTGAMPGDTLAVHIRRLKLNRDWAISDDAVVPRGLDPQLAVQMAAGGKPVRWRLDREKGLAMLDKPGDHTGAYVVPVKPMLGCIATAPPPAAETPRAGDSGPYGGNMDFNEIVEGATVYLPVSVPGALLYFGDGHALQGDGEINGNALETSLDVEVTVELIPQRRIPGPRVENDTHIMGMGLAGSLDDAYRAATANLAAWLTRDYNLTPSEVAEVMGTAVEYRISEVADRNAGVVAKLSKARLATLSKEPVKPPAKP
jgi:acetamidase/formamidase